MTNFAHIEANPEILGGKPCIKNTRISVEFILELIASGGTVDKIANAYQLAEENIQEAVTYSSYFKSHAY